MTEVTVAITNGEAVGIRTSQTAVSATIQGVGPKGDTGATGATGDTGATGQGVPVGGTTGQVLAKASNTNYDTEWTNAGSGSGDMSASTYDPQNIAGDAFDTDNHTDGTTNKVYTAIEKTKLAGIEASADVTDATNVNAVESDPIVGAITGIVKANGTGSISAAVADTDYQDVLSEGAFADGDKTKLDGIETGADVTDEANVVSSLNGATLTSVTPASTDELLLLDASDSNNLKTVTYSDISAGGGSGDAFQIVFTPLSNEPPASNYATLDTRNSVPVLDFDATTDESAVFSGVLPAGYGGGGLTVTLVWMATSATSGTVSWDASIERHQDDAFDIDSDGFAAANNSGAVTVPSASGEQGYDNITFTDGADMDSLAAGESFRIKITRDADSTTATDNASGDAELLRVIIKET